MNTCIMYNELCIVCLKNIAGGPTGTCYVKIGHVGANSINQSSTKRKDKLEAKKGDYVHISCRKQYVNKKCIVLFNRKDGITDQDRQLRSSGLSYDIRNECIFCGKPDKYKKKKPKHKLTQVETHEFEETILDIGTERQDEWAENVFLRLQFIHTNIYDLPAAEAQYHDQCRSNFTTKNKIPTIFQSSDNAHVNKKLKRNPEDLRQTAFDAAINFFRHSDDQMFTINDIEKKMEELLDDKTNVVYSKTTIRTKLDAMSDDIHINERPLPSASQYIFRESVNKVLKQFQNGTNVESSDKDIIQAASKIIRARIKECQQDTDVYPSPEFDIDSALSFIPEMLIVFLKTLFVGSDNVTDRRVAFVGHAMMQCTRPRSLICPLSLVLGVQFHNKFQSKIAVEELHAAGFSSSYSTVINYEHSAAVISGSELENLNVTNGSFNQFMCDNADHNTRTLSGHGTFHGMGMIMSSSTPINGTTVIPRIKITSEEILRTGKVDITSFSSDGVTGPNIVFTDLKLDSCVSLKINDFDLFWKTSLLFKYPRPGYFGTMQFVEKGANEGPGSLIFLPIINMDPTDMSCIYSALLFIQKHTDKYNITPVVTFDYPLYWKSMIIAEKLHMKIVLRLGGFHTEMAWWAAVGDTIEGTGIEQAAECIYARNSVQHIMNGKAFARTQRFHFMNTAALHYILLSEDYNIIHEAAEGSVENNVNDVNVPPDNEEPPTDRNIFDIVFDDVGTSEATSLHTEPLVDSENLPDNGELVELNQLFTDLTKATHFDNDRIVSSNAFKNLKGKLECKIKSLSTNPTSLLWLQYLEMIDIGITYERSEHLGQWQLQIQCLEKMLPYFAATGHFLYTRGVYVYLMKMHNLEKEYPDVYRHFSLGRHCVRRSEKTFSGFFSDGIIEQVFMKNMKSAGGLTRGRGLDDIQQIIWCYTAPLVAKINENMRKITGTSDNKQVHHELFPGRQVRDSDDTMKLVDYYMLHNPFNPPCVSSVPRIIHSYQSSVITPLETNSF